MSPLVQKLSTYAAYHRDSRNIIAHLLGIPLIVFALEVLLSRPVVGVALTPAVLGWFAAAIYYFTLDIGLGLVLAVFMGLFALAGLWLASLSTVLWLTTGAGAFVIGWIIQFLGHGFEGRKPAFFDDVRSLLIGPLFITAEFCFLLGLRRPLRAAIERRLNTAPEDLPESWV
jgi:uncharacterized membrane protein YGL010W